MPIFTKYSVSNNFIYFVSDNDTYMVCRLLSADTYAIDKLQGIWEQYFTKSVEFSINDDIDDSLNRLQFFASEFNKRNMMYVRIDSDALLLSSTNEAGTIEEKVEINKPSEYASYDKSPTYLIETSRLRNALAFGKKFTLFSKSDNSRYAFCVGSDVVKHLIILADAVEE